MISLPPGRHPSDVVSTNFEIMGTFRNLIVWQVAMELVDEIYVAVRSFPPSELYILSQQMRRSALSIPSNIAEGRGRYSLRDERRFFREARGSNYELQTQIEVAVRQQFVTCAEAAALIRKSERVGQLINAYLNSMPKG